MADPDEDQLLRSVAMQNAQSILLARRQAEQELLSAKEALELKTQALARSLAQMGATLQATWDGILVTDDDGHVTAFNERFVEMWRVPRDIVNDLPRIHDHVAAQFADRQTFLDRIANLRATAPAETHGVLELADGRVFEGFSKIQVVEGRPVGRVWTFRDITERRRAEEWLREEARVLGLLNRTGETLASQLDVQALLQAVTDAGTELSGAQFGAFFYNTTDANGDAFMLYTLSGARREDFERFGQPRATPLFGPTFRGEGVIRCDDVLTEPRYGQMGPHHGMPPGHLPVRSYLAVPVVSRSTEVIGGLFFGHSEPGVFTERSEQLVSGIATQAAIAIDNARLFEAAQQAAEERRLLLESEQVARGEAERANSLKDEFLATVSHELRTPLNAILGWSHLLRTGTMSETQHRQGLEVIERNARVQTQLIEDLLDMSRIISGKMRLDIQSVDPSAFIEMAIQTVRPSAEAKGIRLSTLLDPGAGPVNGDPGRLQQVVWNLLSNAIKFTDRNGRVQVVLERVNSHIEIAVADTGVGIKPEFLPQVFDRFRQEKGSLTRTAAGLGLGLSIVKHLVELHGGSVRAISAGEGQGATFTVCLPLTVVQRDGEPGHRLHPKGPSWTSPRFRPPDLSGITVLVVDDQPDARDMIRRVLEDSEADVMTAGSAAEALRAVQEGRPDILVSDIGMPDVDGYELLRRIRALGPRPGGHLPAIALTAFARSEDRTRALRAGFLAHIAKPVEPSELLATIASVVGRAGDQLAD
jgi:signal transduction histidine kinase/ActR/RegA family two-component response regulator